MEIPELSKAQVRALSWIKENQPVGFFDSTGPSLAFTKKQVKLGLVKTSKDLLQHPKLESACIGTFKLSKLGKMALRMYR